MTICKASEAAVPSCSWKKLFLKNVAKITWKHPGRIPFINKVAGINFSEQLFKEHHQKDASVLWMGDNRINHSKIFSIVFYSKSELRGFRKMLLEGPELKSCTWEPIYFLLNRLYHSASLQKVSVSAKNSVCNMTS